MSDNKWIRYINNNHESSKRIIVFPHAGGSANYYTELLNNNINAECIGIQYPGRQDRIFEDNLDSIEALSTNIYKELLKLEKKETVFFGHSMGALVAFELIKKFYNDIQFVKLLILSSSCPNYYDDKIDSTKDLFKYLYELGGTEKEALLCHRQQLEDLVLPTIKNDLLISKKYKLKKQSCKISIPIQVFVGNTDYDVKNHCQHWRKYTTHYLGEKYFKGGHFYFLNNKKVFQDELNQLLNEL
ncbi:thioesterase II family protein [Ligilactobacillus sp. 110_WCHN]|uniref:thioesterase II family protein n=1 Tax=Ligilactobacillus sp. 110_WCHN TaxID=3057125 RepID=UPI0026713D35|nr:thioesterase domain-containing protein [Ligilactobacillus sp. 110_WCHN]MDO3393821.1 thioesterase domain-containing protein [Ligilactobacillus sp. 110_WCHN]